jgi:hypothetical protein
MRRPNLLASRLWKRWKLWLPTFPRINASGKSKVGYVVTLLRESRKPYSLFWRGHRPKPLFGDEPFFSSIKSAIARIIQTIASCVFGQTLSLRTVSLFRLTACPAKLRIWRDNAGFHSSRRARAAPFG